MKTLTTLVYVAVGIVHLIPASGALSASRLQALYGVHLVDPNLVILVRHRAVLFAVIGGLLIAAAFQRRLRVVALSAGLLSMLSFASIAYLVGDFNPELRRVASIDVIASLLLVGAHLADTWFSARDAAAQSDSLSDSA